MQYSSIGWSVGALLGVCAACEASEPPSSSGCEAAAGGAGEQRRRPILLCGDGAFQMSAQEISTVIRYGYKPVIFILNNGGYTVEVEIHDGPYNVINNWNYAKLVEVFDPDGTRTWAVQVRSEEQMEAALAMANGAMSGRTCLIEIILDKDDCSRELLEFGARLTFQASGSWNQAG